MAASLRLSRLLEEFRGEAAVDRDALARCVAGLSRVAVERPDVVAVDLNPLIVLPDGSLVAVDALVEIGERDAPVASTRRRYDDSQFRALFEPRGVVVAGASTHPGKFGFVSLHNILAGGYRGLVAGTNLAGE